MGGGADTRLCRLSAWVLLPSLVSLWLLASPALSAERFDFYKHVVSELARPNVRMVAVAFSASWCGPCKKEQPDWQRIKAMFANRGVRLIVIRYKDADGRMKTYDWPDKEFWDDNGRIGDAFAVGDALPAAFLWSWQGHLLVKKGKATDVAKSIQRFLGRSPRVLVEAKRGAAGPADNMLRALVENELTRLGKFDIVVNEGDRGRMAALRKASHGLKRSEAHRCKIGAEMSANSLVTATLMGEQLLLTLKDIEKACLTQSSTTRINPTNLVGSVAEAVGALAARMKADKVEMPRGVSARQASGDVVVAEGERSEGIGDQTWTAKGGNSSLVTFRSSPPGAQVWINGKSLGVPTAGKDHLTRKLPRGQYVVEMQLPLYKRMKRIERWLKPNLEVSFNLKPNFSLLTVTSEPSGVAVHVDGEEVGKTPMRGHKLIEGPHEVALKSRCHFDYTRTLNAVAGKPLTIERKLGTKMAAIEVDAKYKGDDVLGTVTVDGGELGPTPGPHKVPLCSKQLEVIGKDERLTPFRQTLQLEHKQTAQITAELRDDAWAQAQKADRQAYSHWLKNSLPAGVGIAGGGGSVDGIGGHFTLYARLRVLPEIAWERKVFAEVRVGARFGEFYSQFSGTYLIGLQSSPIAGWWLFHVAPALSWDTRPTPAIDDKTREPFNPKGPVEAVPAAPGLQPGLVMGFLMGREFYWGIGVALRRDMWEVTLNFDGWRTQVNASRKRVRRDWGGPIDATRDDLAIAGAEAVQ